LKTLFCKQFLGLLISFVGGTQKLYKNPLEFTGAALFTARTRTTVY